jgi:hypothetical protein
MAQDTEVKTETIAETSTYLAWKASEPDDELTYHIELGTVTLHFFEEEWEEFLELAKRITGS